MSYGAEFDISEEALDKDFVIPIGDCKIMRPGKDLTITAQGSRVQIALEAAEVLKNEHGNHKERHFWKYKS